MPAEGENMSQLPVERDGHSALVLLKLSTAEQCLNLFNSVL